MKIKRFIALIILLITILSICSCDTEFTTNFEFMCKHISTSEMNASFYRDIDTDIIYIVASGGFSVYYNSKGEPMKYSEFQQEHVKEYHND